MEQDNHKIFRFSCDFVLVSCYKSFRPQYVISEGYADLNIFITLVYNLLLPYISKCVEMWLALNSEHNESVIWCHVWIQFLSSSWLRSGDKSPGITGRNGKSLGSWFQSGWECISFHHWEAFGGPKSWYEENFEASCHPKWWLHKMESAWTTGKYLTCSPQSPFFRFLFYLYGTRLVGNEDFWFGTDQ